MHDATADAQTNENAATPGRLVTAWRALRRRPLGFAGLIVLTVLVVSCFCTLPWTLGNVPDQGGSAPLHNAGRVSDARHAPSVRAWAGTDALGRSVLVRLLLGGAVSLTVGVCAALVTVIIGTAYGMVAGWAGGKIDAVMMRIVDVLYGLPTVLLVVLLAVASDAMVGEYVSRQRERARSIEQLVMTERGVNRMAAKEVLTREPALRSQLEKESLTTFPPRELSAPARRAVDLCTLLVAIGGVSWLTMARVVRGQVRSLRSRPFMEATRVLGFSRARIFFRHLLPNVLGTIMVYATLAVPQAMLQESFLSFLGIGIKPPLPSWGTMAAEGLPELNRYASAWWLLAGPCVLLSMTLIALSCVGEALREEVGV